MPVDDDAVSSAASSDSEDDHSDEAPKTTAMKYQKVRMPMNLLIDSLRRSELQPVSGSGKKMGVGNVATQLKMRYLVIFHGS